MNLKYKKTSRRNFASLPAMCELDIILISSLWERFDREVRDCPSREDKINWYSIRMKTILFSWTRKYIIIPLGFDVVLAPVQVQGEIHIPWWDVSTWCVVPPLHLVARPGNTSSPGSNTELALTGCCSWLSDLELGTPQSQCTPQWVHSTTVVIRQCTVHTWQDSQQVNKISSY